MPLELRQSLGPISAVVRSSTTLLREYLAILNNNGRLTTMTFALLKKLFKSLSDKKINTIQYVL